MRVLLEAVTVYLYPRHPVGAWSACPLHVVPRL